MKLGNEDMLANNLLSDLIISDEAAETLFQRMLTIEFPQSLMKLIISQYFLTEIQGLLFIVEYLKFHILNNMFPEDCVPSASIREFFYEHVCYRMHFDCFCQNVFQVPGSKCNINKWSEEKYIETLELYKRIFGTSPPSFIWRSPEEESASQTKPLLQINLVRLIIYSVYEKCLCQLVKYPQNKSKKIQFEDTVDIEKIMNKITEKIHKKNPTFPRYFYDLNRDQRIEQYKINNIKNHKWRKKFPSQLFKNYSSIENEPCTFVTGGYKFFSGEFEKTRLDSVFNITKYEEFNEQSYISVIPSLNKKNIDTEIENLDDMADSAMNNYNMINKSNIKKIPNGEVPFSIMNELNRPSYRSSTANFANFY